MEHGAPTKIGPPEKHKGPPNSPATGSIPVVGAPNATPPPSETRKTQSGASHHSQSSLSRGRGLTPEERGVFRCTQNLQISMAGAGPLNTVYNKDRHDHLGHPLNTFPQHCEERPSRSPLGEGQTFASVRLYLE